MVTPPRSLESWRLEPDGPLINGGTHTRLRHRTQTTHRVDMLKYNDAGFYYINR